MQNSMQQTVIWEPWSEQGMEYLRLEERASAITADGTIILIEQNQPLRIGYTIRCASNWAVRQIAIHAEGAATARLTLDSDGSGHWTGNSGQVLAALDGCIDVDINATPFTNTLPIRRLALSSGQSTEIQVVYITIPQLAFRPERQRYTCLDTHTAGGLYRYEGLSSGFTTELAVDAAGLVIDYPQIWRRLWPR